MTRYLRVPPPARGAGARAWCAAVLLPVALVVTGCGGSGDPAGTDAAGPDRPAVSSPGSAPARVVAGGSPAAASSPAPAAPAPATAAAVVADPERSVLTPVGRELRVLDRPGGSETHRLAAVRDTGAPLTLLVAEEAPDGWYRVLLPVRPNGSTGWVAADDVAVATVHHRLEMSVAANELRLYERGRLVRTMPAASGTGDTPTPLGSFFLTELLEPTNDGYGPYAYGLSGFSEVLTSFGGGPGQIGLHGTDDPGSVGTASSHGCIRLSDEDITYLARTLPLGTPVDVV
ncbi:L,D-transpeptidase family protein [Aquipuribacter hungaricus]|uniref:L,D-transpeptidase family protein n=2 Tax=Aquipuribacter hungaricus TaxID=545624 RepID=A0ABV7WCV2_9MICO